MAKTITVTLSEWASDLVKGFARAHKATYKSMVEACISLAMSSGGPIILEPFGEQDTKIK